MPGLDFSSWKSIATTLVGLVVISFIAVGVRLMVMQAVQQRRERENRQINERLRTLIAAYKTLGGSFTGDLSVDPSHLKDLQRRQTLTKEAGGIVEESGDELFGSTDRSRRIRDAVEAALSDVILLGTEDQVRLAVRAANDLAAGQKTSTDALVISLRNFIRQVLDLEPVPIELTIPKQGPARPGASPSGGKSKGEGGERESGQRGGGMGRAGMMGGGGVGLGFGGGMAMGADQETDR